MGNKVETLEEAQERVKELLKKLEKMRYQLDVDYVKFSMPPMIYEMSCKEILNRISEIETYARMFGLME